MLKFRTHQRDVEETFADYPCGRDKLYKLFLIISSNEINGGAVEETYRSFDAAESR